MPAKMICKEGQKIGIYTLIEEMEINKHKQQCWRMRCDCGFINIKSISSIINNPFQHCRACRIQDPKKVMAKYINRAYRRSAKERNIGYDLTIHNVELLIYKPCFYCGYKGNIRKANRVTCRVNGIDRINNDYHYYDLNCVTCCKYCNYAKDDMTIEEWNEYLERVSVNYCKNNPEQMYQLSKKHLPPEFSQLVA